VNEMDLVFNTPEFSQTGNNVLELQLKFLNFGLVELYIHVYIYMYIHTHTHTHTHIYICICMYVCIYIHSMDPCVFH